MDHWVVIYIDGWDEYETEPDVEDAIESAERIIGANPELSGAYEIWSKDENGFLVDCLHKVVA